MTIATTPSRSRFVEPRDAQPSAQRIEDFGGVDPRLVRVRRPLLAEALAEHALKQLQPSRYALSAAFAFPIVEPFAHVQLVGPAVAERQQLLQGMVRELTHRHAEVEIPAPRSDGGISSSSLLCSVADVSAIMLRRCQNVVDEPDAIFPPLVLVIDRYDEAAHPAAVDARERLSIRHGIEEILRGGDQVGVHLVITTTEPVDDPHFTAIRTERPAAHAEA